jgi:hypothetical protein
MAGTFGRHTDVRAKNIRVSVNRQAQGIDQARRPIKARPITRAVTTLSDQLLQLCIIPPIEMRW